MNWTLSACVIALSLVAPVAGADLAHSAPSTGMGRSAEEVAAGRLNGVPSEGFSLADLEAMAIGQNPSLVEAGNRVQAARGRRLQAGLYPNPTIGYQGSEIGNEGRAGQQGAFVGQEIVRGNKLGLSRAVAGREIAQAEQELEVQRLRVLTDVRSQFYQVLVAQRTLELSQQLVGVGEQAATGAEALLKAQEVSRVDLIQARIEVDMAKIALENAHNRYLAACRSLAAVLGDPSITPTRLTGDLLNVQPMTWENSLTQLLTSSPELAAARTGVERARWALSRASAEPIPNLDLQLSVQRDNATGSDVAGVQIGLPIPLHNANQGNIQAAEAEVRAALAAVRRLELALQSRLAATFERYANARNQVERYRDDILPNASMSLDLVRQGYQQGEFSFLVVLTAQRTYFQTNLAMLSAVQDLQQSSVEIQGMLHANSLQATQ